ncbi:hypothetical protein [Streptomyces sp. NBC_01262]|uniref:hypothetical protein n=1 Tax=Streptomyces sp. NBC_01262 TaxID=2903803 RepID=UPI002E36AC65|nr:hypothetical protein [Streptomyces sp. NBC_01262]
MKHRLYEEIAWQADMAYEALQQLPKAGTESKPVTAFRGEKTSAFMGPRLAKRVWAKGKRLRQFMSFSRDEATTHHFQGGKGRGLLIVAKLVGKYARDIAPFSAAIHETEILLPPGARLAPLKEEEAAKEAADMKVDKDRTVFVEEV